MGAIRLLTLQSAVNLDGWFQNGQLCCQRIDKPLDEQFETTIRWASSVFSLSGSLRLLRNLSTANQLLKHLMGTESMPKLYNTFFERVDAPLEKGCRLKGNGSREGQKG